MNNKQELFDKLAKGKAKDRRPVTIYLSRPIFEEFRSLCNEKEVSASLAIEQLIRNVLESGSGSASGARNSLKSAKSERLSFFSEIPADKLQRFLAAISGPDTFNSFIMPIVEGIEAATKKPKKRLSGAPIGAVGARRRTSGTK